MDRETEEGKKKGSGWPKGRNASNC